MALYILRVTGLVLNKMDVQSSSSSVGWTNAFSYLLVHVREISASQLNSWSVEFRKIYFCFTWTKYPACSALCMSHTVLFFILLLSVLISWEVFVHYQATWECWETTSVCGIQSVLTKIHFAAVCKTHIWGAQCLCFVNSWETE